MQVFGVNCFFEHYCFVYVLCACVLSCVGFGPPRKQSIVAKHGFWHIYHIHIYIYIYMCVCVVGVSQNEVSFFPLKATVLEPKMDTSFWDIPRCVCVHIYIPYMLFFDMCFLFLSRVSLSHPKNMVFILLHVVWRPQRIRKTVSNQNMFHWKLQYRNKTWRNKTKISKKKNYLYYK